jgi:hypothetical protein
MTDSERAVSVDYFETQNRIPYEHIGWHWRVDQLVRRKSDQRLFRPSHPGHPGSFGYLFREVRPAWPCGWRDTGRVWKTNNGSEFYLARRSSRALKARREGSDDE